MTDDLKERKAFEAWALSKGYSMLYDPHQCRYAEISTDGAHAGWQARAAAGVVPVDIRDSYTHLDDVYKDDEFLNKTGDAAIRKDVVTSTASFVTPPAPREGERKAMSEREVVCIGCEGKPTPENSPCGVCGLTHPQPDEAIECVRALRDVLRVEQKRAEAFEVAEPIARNVNHGITLANRFLAKGGN